MEQALQKMSFLKTAEFDKKEKGKKTVHAPILKGVAFTPSLLLKPKDASTCPHSGKVLLKLISL